MPRFAASMCFAGLLGLASTAQAHFPWLVLSPDERPAEVKLYFGEEAGPDDPDLLDNIAASQVYTVNGRGEPTPITFIKGEWALEAAVPEGQASSTVVLKLDYGVVSRGEKPFLLKYCAKAYPSVLPGSWRAVANNDLLPFEITPRIAAYGVAFAVTSQGQPLKDMQVVVVGPGIEEQIEGETDEAGEFKCVLPEAGQFSIRARMIETMPGEFEGRAYNDIRHYTTLTLKYSPSQLTLAPHDWPALPQGTTSFGAAVVDGWLYVYGGHYGQAHVRRLPAA